MKTGLGPQGNLFQLSQQVRNSLEAQTKSDSAARDSLSGTHAATPADATSISASVCRALRTSRLWGKTRSGKARRRSVSSSVRPFAVTRTLRPWQRLTPLQRPGSRSRSLKMRVHTLSFDPPGMAKMSRTPSIGEAVGVRLRKPR